MDRLEYLLGKLSQECSELAQAASKAQEFGLDSYHPDTGKTNIEAIREEYNDIFAVVRLLSNEFEPINIDINRVIAKENRVNNIQQYLRNQS